MVQFSRFLLSSNTVYADLILRSRDHDNDYSVVGNYFHDTEKILLNYARIYLDVVELCSFIIEQIDVVVHLFVCFTLALVFKPFLLCVCSKV